ncbi:MAG: TIGR03985 family CRISPR-associated protein [Calothrix sp. C42_A2020_038]|nr:TIGR03985 family CRISPR-associated protein [Calothrix sp. C42_A2020_038]
MSELVFTHSPSIELLQWLAQGSLKQNLLRAIRLWVWLQLLYGDEKNKVELHEFWTYADWRDAFFSSTHPKEDVVPPLHDKNCPCAKTTADWIFTGDMGVEESEWKELLNLYCVTQSKNQVESEVSELLILDCDGKGKQKIKKTVDEILQRRLFAVTRRTLQQDLYILKKMDWIKYHNKKYQLAEELPKLYFLEKSKYKDLQQKELTFSNFNLETTIEIFSEPIGGYRRFYLEVDYIIPDNREDVEDTQAILKEVWNSTPIPPVKFTYKSAKLGTSIKLIVYPVCIYYARRAIYLSAFGQTPSNQGEWYNYRLDRIQGIQKLDWSDSTIPEVLLKSYPNKLPTPEYIREQLSDAWGYDFYEQRRLLILRFERNFYNAYIQGTFRHEKFQQISYEEAKKTLKYESSKYNLSMNKFIQKFSENDSYRHDAYYKVYYRDKDVNIMHRLRSWRPNGEVLLPWDLRQKLAQEAIQEVQNYQD